MLRPREKFKIYGCESLNDAELLAIIIQTGNKSEDVVSLSNRLILKYGSLNTLLEQTIEELCTNDGIGKVKAIKIKTIKQINISTSRVTSERQTIKGPEDVYNITKEFANQKQEHLIVICLDTKNNILSINDVLQGTINQIVIHPREVFYPAISCMANSIILVHNHPTGNVTPSLADLETTKKLLSIGEMIGIPIIDHIIVAPNNYYSIFQQDRNKLE